MSNEHNDSDKRRGGLWTRFGIWANQSARITKGQMLGLFIACVVAVTATVSGYKSLSDSQLSQVQAGAHTDKIAALSTAYVAAVRGFDNEVTTYNACLALAQVRIDSRNALRSQFIQAAIRLRATLVSVFPGSDDAVKFSDQYVKDTQAGLDNPTTGYPALDLDKEQAKCQKPGPEPVKPAELQ